MHSFHIPVMGIGFTIDTPLKVAQFGIDSSISLVDDILIERLREKYANQHGLPYEKIDKKSHDYRARRITAYLNMVHELSNKKLDKLKSADSSYFNKVKKYLAMLPSTSRIKKEYEGFKEKRTRPEQFRAWLSDHLKLGSIDVNVMTKVDKENYNGKEKLDTEFNDAHAAVRGFANSKLSSSLILSAGMNPRLYSYIEQFDDFYPQANGEIKKKIVLKVSDFRSALIQAKFLAKKGLWVSEFRIESGLNCGGHAFATEGHLMGPILAEFRDQREEMLEELIPITSAALKNKHRVLPEVWPSTRLSAQGGVGTAEEHDFLLQHYELDSVGWGSPFLLVPEATSVDHSTLQKLEEAREDDIYLSSISPLGVPFQNLRNNTKDEEKLEKVKLGRPGSSCPKRFVALNKEFSDRGMCTASREYQKAKLKQIDTLDISDSERSNMKRDVLEKSCTCVGLGTSALLAHGLDTKIEGPGVAICPGPNLAYFSKSMELAEMTDHIYGRHNVIDRKDRPHMIVKELGMYLDLFAQKVHSARTSADAKLKKQTRNFSKNLNNGIQYYTELINSGKTAILDRADAILLELERARKKMAQLDMELALA